MCLHSSQASCSCFHLLYPFCVRVLSEATCSPMKASWYFVWLPVCWNGLLLCLIEVMLDFNHLSWASLPSRTLSHRTLPSRSLKTAVCSHDVQGCELAFHPPSWPWDPKLHYPIITPAKSALDFHIPNKFLIAGRCEVQQSTLLFPLSLGEGLWSTMVFLQQVLWCHPWQPGPVNIRLLLQFISEKEYKKKIVQPKIKLLKYI